MGARSCLLFASLGALLFFASGQGRAVAPHGPQTATDSSALASPERTAALGEGADCDAMPLADKEACYARQTPDRIAECESMRLHRCAPYAKMHESEQRLSRLNSAALDAATKEYAAYVDDDPDYLSELRRSFSEADRAWRAYLDAQCFLEPLAQGMSRSESADLSEACRADRTAARIAEVQAMMGARQAARSR